MKSTALLRTIGPYRIEDRLVAGGMGAVYPAYDERLGRRVALKHIQSDKARDPRVRKRFLHEARAMAKINHPAIVHVHDLLETEDGEWIVMELVEGTALADLPLPLDVERAVVLAREIAGALAAAHTAGIIHCDLRAENVIVTENGQAKVLDFGLAKAESDDTNLTGSDQVVGTVKAMSPERARGSQVGYGSDLFSLGTLIYEVVTGVFPFAGPSPAAILDRICHHQQAPAREQVPGIPRELSSLIDHLLAKKESQRPRDAAAVVASLARIAEALSPDDDLTRSSPVALADLATESILLADVEQTSPASDRVPFPLRGERRRLTMLCCELLGGTADPGLLRKEMTGFQSLIDAAIGRLDGRLWEVQRLRVVAYFGYPRCHEDNARRAVSAALTIVGRIAEAITGMSARIGVHTGFALLRKHAAGWRLILGETLNLAALLQENAQPGTVSISAATGDLVEGFFDLETLEPCLVPGASALLERCQVMGERDASEARESRRADTHAMPPPLVGREYELALLRGQLQLVREGTGRALLLSGEPGIGKTSLLQAFRTRCLADDPPPQWIAVQASPFALGEPLFPLPGLLRSLLGVAVEMTGDALTRRLEAVLSEHDFSPAETVPLFTALLGLSDDPAAEEGIEELRATALEAVPALLCEMARRQPRVLVIEDLHRLDSATLELIGRLIDQVSASALLLLLTCRPAFRPPWSRRAPLSQISLDTLTRAETGDLVDLWTRDQELSPEAREQMISRSDGVPLFVEELARESSDANRWSEESAGTTVPHRLQDLLIARLDRLGTAKEIAQRASILGREFSLQQLATLSEFDHQSLEQGLEQLLAAEILGCLQPAPDTIYSFRRSLLCEAAAASVLAAEKERLEHRARIAGQSTIDALRDEME